MTPDADPWHCALCEHPFVVPSLARDCEHQHLTTPDEEHDRE